MKHSWTSNFFVGLSQSVTRELKLIRYFEHAHCATANRRGQGVLFLILPTKRGAENRARRCLTSSIQREPDDGAITDAPYQSHGVTLGRTPQDAAVVKPLLVQRWTQSMIPGVLRVS